MLEHNNVNKSRLPDNQDHRVSVFPSLSAVPFALPAAAAAVAAVFAFSVLSRFDSA